MDLTRLYNLTTPELREEAERLGVSDTYAMSRGQLIHAIRNQVDGPPAEGLLGKVVGLAKWALRPRKEEASPRREGVSTPSTPETVSAPVPVPVPVTVPVAESVAAAQSVPTSGTESGTATAAESASVTTAESAAASEAESVAAAALGGEAVSGAEPGSGPPSRPPAGVFSNSAGMFEEPFPTRTMARILAEQGHFKRSLAIYATLLRDEPGDRELSREADEVRDLSRARRPHVY